MYDIAIIGGGVIGCAIARELARYEASVVVVETGSDVCEASSGANSGIVHAGYDAPDGSNRAHYNLLGLRMFRAYAKVLGVPYKRTGSLMISKTPNESAIIDELHVRGRKRGLNVAVLEPSEAKEIEPNLSSGVRKALYAEDAGIVNPFELTFALRENAEANGVKFIFDFAVNKVTVGDGFVTVISSQSNVNAGSKEVKPIDGIKARKVINCAGINGGKIAALFGDNININLRLGEYLLFDKPAAVSRPIFRVPSEKGKGILVCPTTSGNFFIGPTSIDINVSGDNPPVTSKVFESDLAANAVVGKAAVRREAFDELRSKAQESVSGLEQVTQITSYAGLRAISDSGDFIIGQSDKCKYLYNVIGICSPGLTAAPAIASKVARSFKFKVKKDFNPVRVPITSFSASSFQLKQVLIAANNMYGNIVCRCETVSEAEIVEAIKRGARTIEGVKRRLRAGMGRCQGGFCTPRIISLLARELGVSEYEIRKDIVGSELLIREGL